MYRVNLFPWRLRINDAIYFNYTNYYCVDTNTVKNDTLFSFWRWSIVNLDMFAINSQRWMREWQSIKLPKWQVFTYLRAILSYLFSWVVLKKPRKVSHRLTVFEQNANKNNAYCWYWIIIWRQSQKKRACIFY